MCSQLSEIYARISSLTSQMFLTAQKTRDVELVADYVEMRMQELEQAQKLTLKLTGLIVGETNTVENADESAFAEGELTDNLGEFKIKGNYKQSDTSKKEV